MNVMRRCEVFFLKLEGFKLAKKIIKCLDITLAKLFSLFSLTTDHLQ